MSLREMVAKKMLTQNLFKGALVCKTLADWRNFFLSWTEA